MTEFSDDISRCAIELLRSLWAELDVDGSPRRHDAQALDIEPLIVITACFADALLRSKAVDWCAMNARYLSAVRLKHYAGRFGAEARTAWRSFAAAVDEAARAPGRSRASPSAPVLVTIAPDLRRPSLLQLRLRALAGVNARAEVLRLLLADPRAPRTAASLVEPAGYGARGVAEAMDTLTVAGLTRATNEGDDVVYVLTRPAELGHALCGLPETFPDWPAICRVTWAIVRYANGAARASGGRARQAAATMRSIQADCSRIAGLPEPPRVTGEDSVAAFEVWARGFVAGQAGEADSETRQREVVYTVHRLLLGGWIATVKEAGDQPRPLALSDDPALHPDRRASRRMKVDEVEAAATMVESIFSDIRARELQRRHGSLVRTQSLSDSLRPALSRQFASELLQPMHKGQAATFTQEFLQRWSAGHRDQGLVAG